METGFSRPVALSIVANLRKDLSDIRTTSESRMHGTGCGTNHFVADDQNRTWHTGCICAVVMTGLLIANQLLFAVDRLMEQVADDAVLHDGLGRERQRLVICIEHHLGCSVSSEQIQRRLNRYRRKLCARPGVRLGCYRALALGLLPSLRFDVLMLLYRRAMARRSYRGSSSEMPASSSLASSLVPGVGDSEGAASPLLRMNLSSTSTICA